jgi:molecular chaperone GrpE
MARNDSTDAREKYPHPPDAESGEARGENGSAYPADFGEGGEVEAMGVEAFDQADEGVRNELAQCRDRLLRLGAEMENVRRRTAREIQDERKYGSLPLVRDLLGVLDNVDRAVEAGEKSPDPASLLEGFRLVGRQLRSVLEKHDIQPIVAEGEPFDPNLHEAILQQPSDQPSGTVVMVTQPGYRLHDRVVRPSQVIVSAGTGEVNDG